MSEKPWDEPYSVRFAGRKPRVFLGFLAFGDIDPGVFESTLLWAFMLGAKYRDKFEVYFNVAQRREQYRARNMLVKAAIEAEADFIIMIDDDHTLGDCPDMLDHFFAEEKPFQGGLYVQRLEDTLQPVVQKYDAEAGVCRWMTWDEVPVESGPVDILGGGLNWIDMRVFDFMAEPFWWPYPSDERKVVFKPHPRYGLDLHFCIRAKEMLGIQPWLNGNVQVGHAMHERTIVRPPGMPKNMACETCDSIAFWRGDHWYCETCEARKEPGEENRMGHDDFAHREAFRPAYNQLASALCNTFKFDDVLDLGSGQGFLVDELLIRGKKVQGVEMEKEAVAFMSPAARSVIQIGDITNGASPTGDFGLVTCVEVAEHVEAGKSEAIVAACANTAHEYVYFTADDTRSRLHVNPQPKSYWIEKFKRRGFALDEGKTSEIQSALDGTPCPWLQKNSMVFRREANG